MVLAYRGFFISECKHYMTHIYIINFLFDPSLILMRKSVLFVRLFVDVFQAPLFKGLDKGFLRMLSLSIKNILCLPNQIIIKRGDIGKHMYYIHRGEVEVGHINIIKADRKSWCESYKT